MIDIFNFKRYFKKLADNNLARVGHVNYYFPITGIGAPIDSKIKPQYVGQMFIQSDAPVIWIAIGVSFTDWVSIQID